ncbi:MAG TPA: DNA gyrase inhibitor YacG [Candidatus Acidoferrum sp.]|nr:DNA gyrase inhibitor YacG [Candidatus Acidoferrum sp.]
MTYRCPICKTATDSERDKDFPFCSERCRIMDLGNWSSEKYVVSDPIFDEEELEKAEEGRKTIILDLDADSEEPASEGGRYSNPGRDDAER